MTQIRRNGSYRTTLSVVNNLIKGCLKQMAESPRLDIVATCFLNLGLRSISLVPSKAFFFIHRKFIVIFVVPSLINRLPGYTSSFSLSLLLSFFSLSQSILFHHYVNNLFFTFLSGFSWVLKCNQIKRFILSRH